MFDLLLSHDTNNLNTGYDSNEWVTESSAK